MKIKTGMKINSPTQITTMTTMHKSDHLTLYDLCVAIIQPDTNNLKESGKNETLPNQHPDYCTIISCSHKLAQILLYGAGTSVLYQE